MAEEVDFENGRNSNFEGLVTLTLTFDPAIRHIVLQQSSTSTYIPTFIQIEETFCGRTYVRTDGRTDGRTDIFPLYIIRSTFGSRPKKWSNRHLTQSRLQVTRCTAKIYCLLRVVVQRPESSQSCGQLFCTTYGCGAMGCQLCPIFGFWPTFPIQNP